MRHHFDLTDFEWLVIQPLLPNKSHGVPRVDDRRLINGILWRFRTGSPWTDIFERYDPYITCYNRFVRWRPMGVWNRLLEVVSKAYNGELQMVDRSCVRVHQYGATLKKKPASLHWTFPRGPDDQDPRLGVDAEGLSVRLHLSGGQMHDCTQADPLLGKLDEGTVLLADKGYDTEAIRAKAEAPPTVRQRATASRASPSAHSFTAIATRYDKRADDFLAAIKLFSARLWIRAYEPAL